MKKLLSILIGGIGVLVLLGIASALWISSMGKDDGGAGRPTYGTYTWPMPTADTSAANVSAKQPTPRGGPIPRADGYVMGSQGHDFILPPMPPERKWDIHRRDNVFYNDSLKNWFFEGPRTRVGYFSTDPENYASENQLPDTGCTYDLAWFALPAGAKIVVRGEFPHMRYWSFATYSDKAIPLDMLQDFEIDPDAGSFNPFRPGISRDVSPRRYTLTIVNGSPPESRPRNTLYTLNEPGKTIALHMRNYIPDQGLDFLGQAGVPDVEVHLADGKILKGAEAAAATASPMRGKQGPLTVSPKMWLALNSLPWRPADRTPAHDFKAEPMERFYNREYLLAKTFFPIFARDSMAVDKGGFWSNSITRYAFKYLSQTYGSVYVVRGKMPSTPLTRDGDHKPMDQDADMRYWSLCTMPPPANGAATDCLYDEAVRPTLDSKGYFTVVISRAPDRPSNANVKCGVEWMEYGNGDGLVGGSSAFGTVGNRHTLVNPKFKQSWFAVTKPNSEVAAMGEYLPYVINMKTKARFEALGCPVDKTKLDAMVNEAAPVR